MSKEVTLIFGSTEQGTYCKFPLGSALILGVTGSGKSVLMGNILESMLLRYRPEDLEIMLWDGKGLTFNYRQPNTTNVADTRLVKSVRSASTTSLVSLLKEILQIYDTRKYFEYEMRPLLVMLDDVDAAMSSFSPMNLQCLIHLLEHGPECGIYFIITSQSPKAMYCIYDCGFQYIAFTRANSEYDALKAVCTAAPYTCPDAKGNVWVRRKNKLDTYQLTVPFYSRKVKRQICSGEVRPNGATFAKEYLEQLAIANNFTEFVKCTGCINIIIGESNKPKDAICGLVRDEPVALIEDEYMKRAFRELEDASPTGKYTYIDHSLIEHRTEKLSSSMKRLALIHNRKKVVCIDEMFPQYLDFVLSNETDVTVYTSGFRLIPIPKFPVMVNGWLCPTEIAYQDYFRMITAGNAPSCVKDTDSV